MPHVLIGPERADPGEAPPRQPSAAAAVGQRATTSARSYRVDGPARGSKRAHGAAARSPTSTPWCSARPRPRDVLVLLGEQPTGAVRFGAAPGPLPPHSSTGWPKHGVSISRHPAAAVACAWQRRRPGSPRHAQATRPPPTATEPRLPATSCTAVTCSPVRPTSRSQQARSQVEAFGSTPWSLSIFRRPRPTSPPSHTRESVPPTSGYEEPDNGIFRPECSLCPDGCYPLTFGQKGVYVPGVPFGP